MASSMNVWLFLMVSVLLDDGVSGTVTPLPWVESSTRSYEWAGSSTLLISNGAGDRKSPNAFSQYETHVYGGVQTGMYGVDFDWWYTSWNTYPCRLYDDRSRVDRIDVPGGLANMLFANTTPDRADVLLPAAVFELKDLPLAIYHAGRKLIKGPKSSPSRPRKPGVSQASADWVAANFGWLPLIGDLKALVNFSDLAAKREKEFDRMYSKSGLKRRLNLHSQDVERTLTFSGDIPFNFPIVAKGTCSQKIWGTVTWTPAGAAQGSPLSRPTPDYVKRAVLGLNASNITSNLWEAIPWSWFIDYFFNVQDYLIANTGLRTAVPSAACIMIHHKTSLTSPEMTITDPFQKKVKLSKGTLINESKDRNVVFPEFIEASFPILSVKQLSILGALAVLKAPRL